MAKNENDEIELVPGQLVEIDFVMTNLTGIPDDEFTPLGDDWEDDIRLVPDALDEMPATPIVPGPSPAPKSV